MDPTNSLSEDFADLSVRDQQPSLTRVSRERDQFIDGDHKGLNEELMETFGFFREHNANPGLDFYLILPLEASDSSLFHHIQRRNCCRANRASIKPYRKHGKTIHSKQCDNWVSFLLPMRPLFKSLIIIEGVLWPVVWEARRWFSLLF